jgi:quercetin dioxygenase-like cupin family protein
MRSPSGHLHNPITGEHLTFMKRARDTDGALLQVEVRLDPGGKVPRHAHARQDEHVEILMGTVALRVGAEQRILTPGECADVPRRKMHVLRDLGDGEARFLLEIRPALRMEYAMRAMFWAAAAVGPFVRKRP